MKRSKFWSASMTIIFIVVMISSFSLFGLALGQESGSSEGAGEHRSESSEGRREGGGEGAGESGDPSSPILALDESWDGVVNGVRTSMSYDAKRGASELATDVRAVGKGCGGQVLKVYLQNLHIAPFLTG